MKSIWANFIQDRLWMALCMAVTLCRYCGNGHYFEPQTPLLCQHKLHSFLAADRVSLVCRSVVEKIFQGTLAIPLLFSNGNQGQLTPCHCEQHFIMLMLSGGCLIPHLSPSALSYCWQNKYTPSLSMNFWGSQRIFLFSIFLCPLSFFKEPVDVTAVSSM